MVSSKSGFTPNGSRIEPSPPVARRIFLNLALASRLARIALVPKKRQPPSFRNMEQTDCLDLSSLLLDVERH